MSLGNWRGGCWASDGSPTAAVVLPRSRRRRQVASLRDGDLVLASAYKHYVNVEATVPGDASRQDGEEGDDRILAQVHEGVASVQGGTIVAGRPTLRPREAEKRGVMCGGDGVLFLAFGTSDWAFAGPEQFLGGGVSTFDPDGEADEHVREELRQWVEALDLGSPDVTRWLDLVRDPARWRLA